MLDLFNKNTSTKNEKLLHPPSPKNMHFGVGTGLKVCIFLKDGWSIIWGVAS